MKNLICKHMISLLILSLVVIGCSKAGYIEVRNESDATIENVSWGHKVELGKIDAGDKVRKETEYEDALHVFFRKNGKEYMSKETFEVDATTGATYKHIDSSDAEEVKQN